MPEADTPSSQMRRRSMLTTHTETVFIKPTTVAAPPDALFTVREPGADFPAGALARVVHNRAANKSVLNSSDKNDPLLVTERRPIINLPLIEPPSFSLPITETSLQFGETAGFQWRRAFRQSLLFLGIQHAFRLATEKGTRADLKGPFFKDYLATLRRLDGWGDGDPFVVNYIGHSMMGAVTGYIQIQNDPRGIRQEFGTEKAYWKSRLRALGWSTLYSTQFELGPVSEASLGNVGIRPYDGRKHPMAYVDLVVTPVVGTAWLVGEDALDKYLVRPLEDRTSKYVIKILLRGFLNPSRSFANVLRGKWPWYRDDR